MNTLYSYILEEHKKRINNKYIEQYGDSNKYRITAVGYEVIVAASINIKLSVNANKQQRQNLHDTWRDALQKALGNKSQKYINNFLDLFFNVNNHIEGFKNMSMENIRKHFEKLTDSIYIDDMKNAGVVFEIVGDNSKPDIIIKDVDKNIINRISVKLKGNIQWDTSNVKKE